MERTWRDQAGVLKKPDWLKVRLPGGETYQNVVNAALFLLCDASYVTGQTIVVDGGQM
ncbi:SDR family oxidoreductase [candidate division TA06 bacterium]|nr:SDR family oxidoreductase [candidate division TA06 bacterium]